MHRNFTRILTYRWIFSFLYL